MDNNECKELRTRDTVREELAAYAHEAWSGWMRYMFSKCHSNDAGELVIPAWAMWRILRSVYHGRVKMARTWIAEAKRQQAQGE